MYRSSRPKPTLATFAQSRGLEPLAREIFEGAGLAPHFRPRAELHQSGSPSAYGCRCVVGRRAYPRRADQRTGGVAWAASRGVAANRRAGGANVGCRRRGSRSPIPNLLLPTQTGLRRHRGQDRGFLKRRLRNRPSFWRMGDSSLLECGDSSLLELRLIHHFGVRRDSSLLECGDYNSPLSEERSEPPEQNADTQTESGDESPHSENVEKRLHHKRPEPVLSNNRKRRRGWPSKSRATEMRDRSCRRCSLMVGCCARRNRCNSETNACRLACTHRNAQNHRRLSPKPSHE